MTLPDTHSAHRHHPSALSTTLECEIKLSINHTFRLPRLPGTPLPHRQLISTYYDTAAYDLAHARITLCYRIERGKQVWQLKLPLDNDRQEVEIADGPKTPPASLRQLLILHLGHRRLIPIMTLRIWRTGLLVGSRRAPVAELTVDHVTAIKNGTVIQRFHELKIERRHGNDNSLHTLERQMREAGASDHDGQPKLFRALSRPATIPAAQPPPQRLRWSTISSGRSPSTLGGSPPMTLAQDSGQHPSACTRCVLRQGD